ncbi:hypothetical protein PsAD13_03885 [Pseudovibrio sp. Ad13]|uniref:VCBS domain-containing protein n=1 Tax=Pseudovibrio sp. Ad13 TaxID=989396 RepID=UPI0007AEB636|nr:VCBS domain-containing protein [Pseudovibrio sp. Ad13]KZK82326.1 hypothetical protein PsAD13_03885 [Pseudovibrio sp. Ad13]
MDVVFEDKYHSDHDFTSNVKSMTAEGETSGVDEEALLCLLSPNDFSLWRYADLPQGQGNAHFEFNAPAELFDYLKRGESITLTYTVEINNGGSEPVTQELKIIINGRDDLGTSANDHLVGSKFNDYIRGL